MSLAILHGKRRIWQGTAVTSLNDTPDQRNGPKLQERCCPILLYKVMTLFDGTVSRTDWCCVLNLVE